MNYFEMTRRDLRGIRQARGMMKRRALGKRLPVDKEQTPKTFHPYILEEYHEMVQGIKRRRAWQKTWPMRWETSIFLVVFVAAHV